MDWKKKILRNIYLQQAVLAGIGVLVLLFLLDIGLNVFTRHGEARAVPEFRLMSLDSAMIVAKQHKLRLEIVDSVFVLDQARGSVYDQIPKAGSGVKTNRKIFLTMNALHPKQIPVPYVVGMSLRQAKSVLASSKFRVAKLNYISDIATNNVLQQTKNGQDIEKGVLLPEGSEINLVLGLDSSSVRLPIPRVIGLNMYDAQNELTNNSLNVNFHFESGLRTISDSLSAKVYKQDPPENKSGIVVHGSTVNVYLRKTSK